MPTFSSAPFGPAGASDLIGWEAGGSEGPVAPGRRRRLPHLALEGGLCASSWASFPTTCLLVSSEPELVFRFTVSMDAFLHPPPGPLNILPGLFMFVWLVFPINCHGLGSFPKGSIYNTEIAP